LELHRVLVLVGGIRVVTAARIVDARVLTECGRTASGVTCDVKYGPTRNELPSPDSLISRSALVKWSGREDSIAERSCT
jgi:hypothetical protein